MTSAPTPATVEICTTCGERWSKHAGTARSRLLDRLDPFENDAPEPTSEQVQREVNYQDCVLALQARNRGPVGPVGPMGAAGYSRGGPIA